MTQRTRPVMKTVTAFLLTLLMLVSLIPFHASAAGTVYESTFELTGKYSGKFTLNASDSELFALEHIVPGDSWRGKINFVNTGNSPMVVSVISIESNIEDELLFKTLDLKIFNGETVLFDGSYGSGQTPLTEKVMVDSKSTVTFDVIVTLPITAGNEIMNKEMDSTWTFEADYHGGSGNGPNGILYEYVVHYVDEDGNHLLPSKHGFAQRQSMVTEKAEDIEGYTPNLQEQTIRIKYNEALNVITFIYKKDAQPEDPVDPPVDPVDPPVDPEDPVDPPVDPEDPIDPPVDPEDPVDPPTDPEDPIDPDGPDKPGEDIKTGNDLTQSNSDAAMWLLVLTLTILAAAVIYLRIRAEKKRVSAHQSATKTKEREASENDT